MYNTLPNHTVHWT